MPRTIFLLCAALVLAVGLSTTTAPSAGAQGAALDCVDFPNQAAAQAAYRADPSDPANNDADEDGIACELFAYADPTTDLTPVAAAARTAARPAGAATAAAPVRMPSAGVGEMAATVRGWPIPALPLLALAAGFGGLGLWTYRRTA